MKRAFTLIELLVIIAILAAILFPVFAQAKMAAKKTSDLSSVKQVTLSTMIYTNDVDDTAPSQNKDNLPDPWFAGSGKDLGYMDPTIVQCWAASIQPYIKSLDLQVSVAAPKDPDPNFGYRNKPGAGNSTWMMNGALLGKSMTATSAPSDLVLYQGKLTTTRESLVQPTFFDGVNCNGIDRSWIGNTFANASADYGWADGHASYKKRTQITFRNMNLSGTAHRLNRQGWADVPNTTSLTDPKLNDDFWQSWGECNIGSL